MNGPGRAIQAAVWSDGDQLGPGGSAMRELYDRGAPKSGFRPIRRTVAEVRCGQGPTRRGGTDRAVFGLRLQARRAAPRSRQQRQHIGGTVPITELAPRVSSTRPEEPPRTPRRAGPRAPTRARLTLAAVLGWCTAIAVFDAFAVDGAVLIGLLITGPLLAAIYGSSRATAITGGYAVLLGLVLGFPD